MTFHVASTEEQARLLTARTRNTADVLHAVGITCEWMVSDFDDQVEWVTMYRTDTGENASFEIMKVDGGFELIPMKPWSKE